MTITSYLFRFLLTLLFVWHGLQKLLMHQAIPNDGLHPRFTTFYALLSDSGFLLFVGFCQLLCGILLVFKKTSLLGAVMLVPLLLCLVMTHVFISRNTAYLLFDVLLLFMNGFLVYLDFARLKTAFLAPQQTLF